MKCTKNLIILYFKVFNIVYKNINEILPNNYKIINYIKIMLRFKIFNFVSIKDIMGNW